MLLHQDKVDVKRNAIYINLFSSDHQDIWEDACAWEIAKGKIAYYKKG